MSRFSAVFDNGIEVAWGYDHACGYFVQVFDNGAEEEDYILEDLDSLFDNINRQDVIRIAEKWGVDPVHVDYTLE